MKKLLTLLFLFNISVVFAANNNVIHPSVHLLSMKAVSTAEKRGDELYLNVTVFHSEGESDLFRFPAKPLYWPSEHIEKVDNLQVWDGQLKNGESAEVLFSLVEHDMPPWNTDDLVGTVRLHIKNTQGALEASWSMPNRTDSPMSVITKHGRAEKFSLIGDHGHYDLYFMLKIQ